jgi:hypothetical protein
VGYHQVCEGWGWAIISKGWKWAGSGAVVLCHITFCWWFTPALPPVRHHDTVDSQVETRSCAGTASSGATKGCTLTTAGWAAKNLTVSEPT